MLISRFAPLIVVISFLVIDVNGINTTVSTSEELQAAIDNASPGDVIILAPLNFTGTYVATKNGTEEAPITIIPENSKSKIIGSGENETCFVISGNYWVLKSFAVSNYNLGILINGTRNILDSLAITNITRGVEIEMENNTLNACALDQLRYGITVKANRTILTSNAINAANHSIITEENTCCGEIKYNSVNGGTMELKGSDYVMEANVIKGHLDVSGCGNSFQNEVDVTPVFLTKCENPDLGGNTYLESEK